MIWLALYLGIGLINMAVDGALCVISKRRYVFWVSLVGALLWWPITAPMEIWAAVKMTRKYPCWRGGLR